MRIAIMCNGRDVALWQRRAIELLGDRHEFFLLVSDPAPAPRRSLRHALYYALNLFAVRNRLARPVPFPDSGIAIAGRFEFTPLYEGAWAVLPEQVLSWIRDQRIDAVVKFNLSLLRIPEPDRLAAPILSYHHGDPRKYRGRPAGFYEMQAGNRFVGQIVQILSNRLDAGKVVAFAESRVISHSYRRTLLEAYGLSPHLLRMALEAVAAGETLPIEPAGRNYRLPGNLTVARFLVSSVWQLLKRAAYGALVEKRWNVATVEVPASAEPAALVAAADSRRAEWRVQELLPAYSFYADCFFHTGPDDLLVEAMSRSTGKGELVRIENGRQQRVDGLAGHISYPMSIEEDGRHYVVPETELWSRPSVFVIEGGRVRKVASLDIGEAAIIDPTLLRAGGRVFLFGNRPGEGAAILHLWSAPSLFGRFEPHPRSPIRVSARGSRMAGEIMRAGGNLYRLGQDFRESYGDGILAFRIVAIDEHSYQEAEAGEASFSSVRGPHTLNVRGETLLFDFYSERRSLLAGVRRVLHRF